MTEEYLAKLNGIRKEIDDCEFTISKLKENIDKSFGLYFEENVNGRCDKRYLRLPEGIIGEILGLVEDRRHELKELFKTL